MAGSSGRCPREGSNHRRRAALRGQCASGHLPCSRCGAAPRGGRWGGKHGGGWGAAPGSASGCGCGALWGAAFSSREDRGGGGAVWWRSAARGWVSWCGADGSASAVCSARGSSALWGAAASWWSGALWGAAALRGTSALWRAAARCRRGSARVSGGSGSLWGASACTGGSTADAHRGRRLRGHRGAGDRVLPAQQRGQQLVGGDRADAHDDGARGDGGQR
ncbi:uncharacterized protein CMC5_060930 [Chondromyces crocatus]|uniref:Uncharacterized protein n=1 Tax=Chondromyces crocatus TaxID=52 RepID=A0A0K1EMK5_CHOCO|nr:uncharacterized protein CMC5_060930 [Chondromyces crocatus]